MGAATYSVVHAVRSKHMLILQAEPDATDAMDKGPNGCNEPNRGNTSSGPNGTKGANGRRAHGCGPPATYGLMLAAATV